VYSQARIIDIFHKTGVIQEGHFVLSSGRHADKYLQCAKVLQHPEYANELGENIAGIWQNEDIDVVIGPAIGGIIVSYIAAQALGVRSVFTERKEGKMKMRRSFELSPGDRVLIVEDVVTTGGSVREVIELLEERDVNIVGISPLVDRSGGQVSFPYTYKPVLQIFVNSYPADECELCEQGVPITKPGSKKEI